jgi:hypothetical protein
MQEPDFEYRWSDEMGVWLVKRGRFWGQASVEQEQEIELWERIVVVEESDPRVRRPQ